jgi:hypothetical protein
MEYLLNMFRMDLIEKQLFLLTTLINWSYYEQSVFRWVGIECLIKSFSD